MNKRLFYRLLLDFCLFILLLLLIAYPLTDYLIHEIVGLAFILLIIKHNIDNRGWYKSLFKGKYNLVRLLHNVVNIGLIGLMLINFVTATGISLWLFRFLPIDWGETGRTWHSMSGYWTLVFIALHIGFHWNKLMAIAKNSLTFTISNTASNLIQRILVCLIASYGIYAMLKLQIIPRLVGYYAYFFWDESQSSILFFVDYCAFITLCIALTYYTLKLFKKRK